MPKKGEMHMTRSRTIQVFISTLILSLLLTTVSFAVPATFFGEDLGLGENIPLPTWPLAAGAEAVFLSNLIGGVGTEDFEGFANGTPAPLPVTFFGFVDTEQSYTGITLGNTAPGVDYFGFDDMTVATGAEILTGACCLEGFQCVILSSGECVQVGNGIDDSLYMGDGTDCVETCDNVVSVENATWGAVKSLYR
jgi:hypothetical protein